MASDAGRGTEGSAKARERVVERLRLRRLETDEAIFARVRDLVPGAAGLADPEYIAGLRAAVAAALEYVLAGIERGEADGSLPTPAIPAVALEQARRAARTGVSLDTVLRRYLAGLAILEGFVVQEAEREGLPSDGLRDVLGSMSTLVDRLITAVSRAYGEQLERAGYASSPPSPPPPASVGRVVGPRRDRILEAMVELAAQRGFERTTLALVTKRAGISTRTFYEEFDGLKDCFLAVLDLGLARAGKLIAHAFADKERWQDGTLAALASLLAYFDSEPALTRIWFVEALAAGSWALRRREQIVGMLRSMIVEYSASLGQEPPEPVAATGVMASVLGLIQTHMVTERPGPLIELLGPLMGLVTSLHLDREDIAHEVQRGAQLAREIQAGKAPGWALPAPPPPASAAVVVPAVLRDPRAHRMRQCLLYVARQGGRGLSPSNQEVGKGIGVSHRGQLARLLGSLVALGLLCKRAGGPGQANAWSLSAEGERVARALAEQP